MSIMLQDHEVTRQLEGAEVTPFHITELGLCVVGHQPIPVPCSLSFYP